MAGSTELLPRPIVLYDKRDWVPMSSAWAGGGEDDFCGVDTEEGRAITEMAQTQLNEQELIAVQTIQAPSWGRTPEQVALVATYAPLRLSR
ncbi:MAG: hypothetical protein ABID04_01735 [Patescibacteria group bacterium]